MMWLSLLVVVGYVGGILATALTLGAPWSTVSLYEANRVDNVVMTVLVQPLTWLCGSLVFTFGPGLPWAAVWRRHDGLFSWLTTALAMSIGAQIVIGTLIKAAWGPLDRPVYLVMLLVITATGWVVAASRPGLTHVPPITSAHLRSGGVALASVVVVAVVFWGKLIHENFNGDGLEAFELARSLVQGVLPRWDTEVAGVGAFAIDLTHPPLLAFLQLPALLLFGFTEASVRGVLVFAWLLIIPTAWLVVEAGSPAAQPRVRLLAILGLLPLVLNALFYSGTDHFSELAKCGEIVLLGFALASFALMQRGHQVPAVVFAIMASGIRWYGAVIMVAAFGLMAIMDRRHRRGFVVLVGVVGGIGMVALLVGAVSGALPNWQVQFRYEFLGMLQGVPGWRAGTIPVAWHFLLFSGFLAPAVALWPWQDATTRVLSALTIATLGFVSSSSLVANHYLVVPAYLPTLVVCRMVARSTTLAGARVGWAMAMVAVMAASVCLMPTAVPVHRATRVIAQQICIDAATHTSAMDLLSVADLVAADARFLIGPHAVAHYGRVMTSPGAGCTYYVSTNPSWAPAVSTPLGEQTGHRTWADPERRAAILAMEIPSKDTFYRLSSLRAIIVER